MRIRALLLDLHGTVMVDMDRFDAGQDYAATWRRVEGPAADPAIINRQVRAVIELLLARYDDPSWRERFPRIEAVVAECWPEAGAAETRAVAAVIAEHERGCLSGANVRVLQSLAERYPLAVISNLLADKASWLEAFGAAGLSDILTDFTASSDHGCLKPSPRLFAQALASFRRADIPDAEVLMVGDDYERDIRPAVSLGLRTAWITADDGAAPGPEPDLRVPRIDALEGLLLQ